MLKYDAHQFHQGHSMLRYIYWFFGFLCPYFNLNRVNYEPWTPPLNNPWQINLLWIVSNKCCQVEDNMTIMAIWAMAHNRNSHAMLKWHENVSEWCVINLTLEFLKSWAVIVLSVTYKSSINYAGYGNNERRNSLLFGITRNTIGTMTFRCARRTVLWMFLIDMYKGWYSIWPVATDTVVLSAPRIIGQY